MEASGCYRPLSLNRICGSEAVCVTRSEREQKLADSTPALGAE